MEKQPTPSDFATRLDAMRDDLNALIDDREATWEGRSERWQDSEKGDEWEARTEQWRDVRDNVEAAIFTLEEMAA